MSYELWVMSCELIQSIMYSFIIHNSQFIIQLKFITDNQDTKKHQKCHRC